MAGKEFARPKTVTHLSTNRARRRATSLMRPTALRPRQTATVLSDSTSFRFRQFSVRVRVIQMF